MTGQPLSMASRFPAISTVIAHVYPLEESCVHITLIELGHHSHSWLASPSRIEHTIVEFQAASARPGEHSRCP